MLPGGGIFHNAIDFLLCGQLDTETVDRSLQSWESGPRICRVSPSLYTRQVPLSGE